MAYNKAQVTIDLEEYQALLDAQKSLTNNRWYKAVQVLAQLIPLVADQYRKPCTPVWKNWGLQSGCRK